MSANPPERPALGYTDRLDGIDVSYCQQAIDYPKVARAKFKFVVIKMSEGLTGVDPMHARHIEGFRSVGMYVLAYHFMRLGKGSPREQVRKLWESMGDTYVPMCLDFETRNPLLSSQQHVDLMEEAAEEVLVLGALKAKLYTYKWFGETMQPALERSRLAELTDLWFAYYNGRNEPFAPLRDAVPLDVPKPWPRATLWQYGGNGGYRVPGVPGACDRNLFMGSEEDFRTRMLGLPPLPPTVPEVA